MKIKGQGTIVKCLASQIATRQKKIFSKLIKVELNLIISKIRHEKIDVDVVSFSSAKDFEEQMLSILSFMKYVGNPSHWVIYSDGTHTNEQINILSNFFPFVFIQKCDLGNKNTFSNMLNPALIQYLDPLYNYANMHALGKKLFFYLTHSINKLTIFTDSDVLFYPKANIIKSQLIYDKKGYFLPERKWGSLDSRYKINRLPEMYQVNSGFFIAYKNFDCVSVVLKKMFNLYNGKYEYFSEQTIFHVLLQMNGYIPLDPRIFILDTQDQFNFYDYIDRDEMAIRHYTGPVRHKIWQKGWKYHLNLK
ncbi:MAG: hypothetical protein LBD41_06840 [Clostridiales Family XIII bacterium]|jgi:hypothetical protein|nr:hypothetical protein [Clostridiales Family XIII bacterium]